MQNLFRLLKYAKKYWTYLFISMAALITITLTQLFSPWAVQKMVGLVVDKHAGLTGDTLRLACLLGITYLVQAVCQYLRGYYSNLAAWRFVSDIRVKLYNHLQKLSLSYYHDKQTGDLMSRISYDTGALKMLIANTIPDIIVNVLILSGVTIILFSIHPYLALACLGTTPFLLGIGYYYVKKIRPLYKQTQQTFAQFNSILQDNLTGIKEIQAFNRQERELGRVEEISSSHVRDMLKAQRYGSIFRPGFQFFISIGTALIVGFSGYLVANGSLKVNEIVAFILYLGLFYQPISALSGISEDIQYALVCTKRIFEVLDTEPDVKECIQPYQLPRVKGNIRFENVSFHYTTGPDVLNNICLDIQPGESIALVGPSGVGKTTLANLVTRFYDPTSGRVLLDGWDLRDVSLQSLRNNISIVLQDVFLFNGTVAENIAFGAENPSMDAIVQAAKIAHAHEFIEGLENGYETLLGERGIRLSGGQKQRISIARAVLRDTPILILDEATSAVDTETEKLIHDAIRKVIKDRTTLIVAHRLSTVKAADRIIVIKDGEISEMGTHTELIEKGGLYSHLSEVQFREKEVG